MKKWSILDSAALGILAGLVLLTAALYGSLPARVPSHFDAQGVADAWMPRAQGAWILPIAGLGVWVLVRFGGLLLPAAGRERLASSPTDAVGFLVVALLAALHSGVLYAAIHGVSSIGTFLGIVLGATWVALGLVLPRVRRNPFIGIRTPWTLASDENWARTHRFGSYTFVAGGVLAVLLALADIRVWPVILIVLSGLAPVLYSFLLARKLSASGSPER